jgi:hypothetical protein
LPRLLQQHELFYFRQNQQLSIIFRLIFKITPLPMSEVFAIIIYFKKYLLEAAKVMIDEEN